LFGNISIQGAKVILQTMMSIGRIGFLQNGCRVIPPDMIPGNDFLKYLTNHDVIAYTFSDTSRISVVPLRRYLELRIQEPYTAYILFFSTKQK